MKKKLIPFFGVFIFCALLFSSCSKDYSNEQGLATDTAAAVAKMIPNQAYGTNAAQIADFYLPAKRTTDSTKTLILLHGGFWAFGDKSDLDSAIIVLQTYYPTLAIVNMNYRLANYLDATTQFPAQMTDIKLLLDYLTANKDSLKISTKYALAGVSAGGQLALEFAYKYDVSTRVKVVAGIVPPTNFLDPYYLTNPNFQAIAYNFIGQPITNTAAYQAASPGYTITSSAPPTFVSFGAKDTLVPPSSATFFKAKLDSVKITYNYTSYPNDGHEFSSLTLFDTLTRFIAFLKLYF